VQFLMVFLSQALEETIAFYGLTGYYFFKGLI
jgi:hypothetical protein